MDATDIKLYAINLATLSLSLTNLEPVLKVILLILSIGYTAIRIYTHLEDKIKDQDKK